ncbi:MAG: Hint domain-containing protein [Pseudomonadota bacterium]
MTLVFRGLDNEFAASTGSNVDVTPNTSRFDNPPNGSKDLVITAKEGDPDPRTFELGDTYDITWGGQGGGGTIQNAVVIRSDDNPSGGPGGVIVFEGTDENGDPAQIIWTPGIDLEGWYQDNYNPSMEPEFYTADQNASYNHTFVCFAAGTLIDTAMGPVRVEDLRAGDHVLTLDAGPQPVIWAGRRRCNAMSDHAPVRFETGTVGNAAPLFVSPQHRMLVRSPLAEIMLNSSEVLVAAKCFEGLQGVARAPQATVTYCHVLLAAHHLIWANGALCETLLPGAVARTMCRDDPGFAAALHAHGLTECEARPARPIADARDLAGLDLTAGQVGAMSRPRMCSVPRPAQELRPVC